MAAVAEGNTALLSFAWNSAKRCPLSSQGQAFNFSVAIGKYFCISVFISSVRSSNSHPDLLLTHHHPTPPHFFRSHRSSTLDFHFLSQYSYIKAIMLYKGHHWT